jgi:hypothetical protein
MEGGKWGRRKVGKEEKGEGGNRSRRKEERVLQRLWGRNTCTPEKEKNKDKNVREGEEELEEKG